MPHGGTYGFAAGHFCAQGCGSYAALPPLTRILSGAIPRRTRELQRTFRSDSTAPGAKISDRRYRKNAGPIRRPPSSPRICTGAFRQIVSADRSVRMYDTFDGVFCICFGRHSPGCLTTRASAISAPQSVCLEKQTLFCVQRLRRAGV